MLRSTWYILIIAGIFRSPLGFGTPIKIAPFGVTGVLFSSYSGAFPLLLMTHYPFLVVFRFQIRYSGPTHLLLVSFLPSYEIIRYLLETRFFLKLEVYPGGGRLFFI